MNRVANESITISKAGQGVFRAFYNFKGTVLIKKGPKTVYDIMLPNNPDTIYSSGQSGAHNPCTDDHYQGEGDFWYFWNPHNPGCKLKEKQDYQIVSADFASRVQALGFAAATSLNLAHSSLIRT